MKVFIAGQNGYIGGRTSEYLREVHSSIDLIGYNKTLADNVIGNEMHQEVSSVSWQSEFRRKPRYANIIRMHRSVDCVVHLGGLRKRSQGVSAEDVWHANVFEPESSLKAAIETGVRRFVFLSSIAVNGTTTEPGRPFNSQSNVNPESLYAKSKYVAECTLKRLASEHKIELIIIRAPMIYGPNAPGTFDHLIRLIKFGIPLPLKNIRNYKSFLSIYNLVNILALCIADKKAENGTYFASDGDDISTSDFVVLVAKACQVPARLFGCNERLIAKTLESLGMRQLSDKLIRTCQIDIAETQAKLKWSPGLTVTESLERMRREMNESIKI